MARSIVAVIVALQEVPEDRVGPPLRGGTLMVVPSVGQLVIEMAMYRFASNLSLLLKSGVPMMETMHTITGIFQTNPIYRDALERVAPRSPAGKSLHSALEETGLFLPMLTSMVQVGEESGQLAPGHGADLPLLQGEDGRHDPEGHQDGRAHHHHGHGLVDRRLDAGDLHADVRDGGERQMMPKRADD